uniref:dockerin type I domain-containing protein n=1 Tax=Prevotella sp. TaxID=59823 RepID=UPI00402883A4
MRKDVLISLLAITGAPVAALADADVVIDKTAWSGDDLTVSEDGSVTVSTGKEVSIEKELAPGKYMLQRATFTDNAKIVAVYKGKEYAPEVAFTIEGDAPAKVRVKVRAVTPGEFKFSGVKFTLIFDFAAPVKELGAQLGEIVSGTSDYFRRTDAWTKGKDGKPSLEMQVADYASQLDIIEKGDYDVYVKNHLWQGKNSPELRALAEGIGALAKVVEKANDNENAYFSAQNAYEAAEYQFRSFSSTWYTVAEEIRATYQADYNKIQQSINDFKALAREKYDAGEAKELKTAEFTENFNRMLNELETNIGVSDAAWINIYAVYQDGLRVFNAAQEEIHTQMPDDGNYADWNEEALNAMRSAWKKVSDLYKTIDADKTKASELEENFRTLKEAQVVVINATKDEYLAKHVDAEAKKAAADQLLSALEDDFQYLEKSDDVNQKYANRVKEIRTAINALKDKVAKDYKAPHNIRTASYDADRDAIQAKINSLRSDAGAIIQNYENYQKLLKALGTETGLQKKLDDAKAAVAKMKPAAEGDTYDMAAHFQKTAAGLQKTIDEIKAAVEKGYQEKTLTETVRGDFQSQIDAAAMAVGKYQDDATAAMARYDVMNTAIKDYKGALATLRATVGTKTLVVATPATEVTGKTYGERITQLQTEIDRVAGNFSAAKEKLDADLLAALLAVQLKETILTDAQALNAAFANDKVNSDKTAKIEAAKAMYDAASKVVDAIKADIDEYKGVPYEYYNVTWTEDNLELKYDELLQDLNDIEANANTQKAKIQAVAATEDDITEDNAVEAMSLLSVIKGDVDAINDALSELLTRVNAQKAHVNAEKQAYTDFIGNQYYYYPKGAELVSRTLTEAKNAFVIPGESIDPQIQATTTKLEALKAEAATARAKEILQESCKDSYDAEGHVVKGITSRLNDLQLEANALKALAIDSTANYDAYQKLKDNFVGQRIDIWNYSSWGRDYTTTHYGFANAFDAVRTRINQKTNGTNAAYYLSLLAYPDGVHFKERQAIEQAIEAAYKAGKAWTGSFKYNYNTYKNEPELNTGIARRMTDLSNVLKMLPKQAYNDYTNNSTQVDEGNKCQALWDEVNGLFNASDLRPETLKPYLSKLGDLLKRIKEQKTLVEKYYAEGLTTTNHKTVSEAYRSIKLKLDELKAFIEGNSEYNGAIAGDNLTRYNTFCAKVQETEDKYGEGTAQIAGYQNISTEELKELVNVESIIAAQENIYKYAVLIKDLKDEAAATYANTTSPALWDIEEANAKKAQKYTDQIEAYKKELDLAVNTAVRVKLEEMLANLNDNQLAPAKEKVAGFDKNVRDNAFANVQEFYDRVSADDYKKSQLLVSNLDNDWNFFGMVPNLLVADLEQAAQNEWKALYEGVYVGVDGTLTEGDDRYAGAKADNEKWLAALEGFAYEGKDDDLKSYKDCVAKYLTPATELAAKAADGTFTGKIADLQRYINAFYAEAGAVYTSAKAKADAYDANIKNFDQLTIDYNTVTERIKTAQEYYGAFNVASSRIEANIASAFNQVKRWQADLTRQNASQEMSKRVYGLIIGEDKQWYDCHSIKILSIDGIYNAANQAEVDAIKADIVAIETQKREALDNLTGTAADEVKAYYDEHCKNLAKELDDLLKEFDENATPAEAKKDAGLLALEKKVAQARMGLIKLVNAELIEGVANSLEMLVSQAESSYSNVNITYDGVYTPVKVEYKSALDACRNELDGVKNLITSYGDEIVTYKTKVIHLLNVLIDRMGATRMDIIEANKPYVAHAKAMKDLQDAYDALVAEQTRVKELIASYQHSSTVLEESSWKQVGNEVFVFERGKSYMENYEKLFFNVASEKAEEVSGVLEQAAKTLEEGPVSAILTDSQVESYKDGSLKDAYAKLETVEVLGAWYETKQVYQFNVLSALYDMEKSFYKSGTKIYDEDGALREQFDNLKLAQQNFDNYLAFGEMGQIDLILPTKDINGNAWLNPDGSVAAVKPINYPKDEEYGVKLVAATSESLVESMNALRTSIEENTYVLGDVTEDGVVLTDDYLAVLNALLDSETLEGGKVFAAADVNRDGKISIADVTLIAAKVTNGLWPSLGGSLNAPMVGSENLTVSAEDNNGVQRIAINLENRKDYVACQMDIVLPAGMTVVGESVGNRANGHALYSKDIDGVHRVVISTIENNCFTNGSAILYLDVQGGSIDKVALDKVIFAEANGRETYITGSDATGINGMEAEGSLKQKIYTVGGQLLDKVKQGINIVRNANGKTQKVTGK